VEVSGSATIEPTRDERLALYLVIVVLGTAIAAFGGGLPTMLLVDKKGVVREVFVGYDPTGDARVETVLKALLAEAAPAPVAAVPPPPTPPSAPRPPAR